jgi:signal transduction histidine kinase
MAIRVQAELTRHPWPLRGWALDITAGVVLTGVFVLVSSHIEPSANGRHLDALGYALLVVAGGAIALSRRRPHVAVGLVTLVLGCFIARHYPNGPVWASGWIVLLALSWRTDRRTAVLGSVAMLAVLTLAAVAADRGQHRSVLLPLVFLGWSAAAVFLGDALRNRRSYLVGLEERARYLERSRDEEARRRVAEERLRIARDLHDSVAHAMATINVQAGAAGHVLHRRPEAAKEALAVIQRASREVLDELAAMLTVLRDTGGEADRAPTPGVGAIGWLVESTRDSGLPVSVTVEGAADQVPQAVGTAAYRIVQESLTNVIRHAGPATARVIVQAGPDRSLTVEVRDDGKGNPRRFATTGVGIRGMRERAESTGGRLEAGPGADGGFVVRASWEPRP